MVQMSGWQPIETAPRDGDLVLLKLARPLDREDLHDKPDRNIPVVVGWWDGAKLADEYQDYARWQTSIALTPEWDDTVTVSLVDSAVLGWMPLPAH